MKPIVDRPESAPSAMLPFRGHEPRAPSRSFPGNGGGPSASEATNGMRLLLLVTGVLFTCHPAARAGTFLWQASSGFTPDAVAIPMGLEDTATANPVLASGVLTLSTTGLGETMRYAHVGSGTLLVPALPEIEARVRHVSGSFDYPGRRAIGITFTVAAGVGASVMIGEDIVLTSISGGGGVSQSAVVDTDDAFHD